MTEKILAALFVFIKSLVTEVQAASWWTPNSRLIVTWDEGTQSEQVATIVVGAPHGSGADGGSEYGTLRGLEEAYGVGLLGHSADPNVGDIRPLLSVGTSPPAGGMASLWVGGAGAVVLIAIVLTVGRRRSR